MVDFVQKEIGINGDLLHILRSYNMYNQHLLYDLQKRIVIEIKIYLLDANRILSSMKICMRVKRLSIMKIFHLH